MVITAAAAGSALKTAAPYIGKAIGGISSIMGLFGDKGTNAAQAMALQYEYQKKLQQQQYDLTQQGYRESPKNQRLGLESAGYNPILAVTNGVQYGNYSSGQSSAISDNAEQTNARSNRFNSAINAMSAIAGLKATNASALKMEQEAQTEAYKRENLWQDSMLKRSMEVLNNEQAPWVAKKAAAQIANLFMTGQAAVTGANAQKLQADTSAKWTPVGIGAGVAAGIGGYVLGKVPGLKYLKKKKVGF